MEIPYKGWDKTEKNYIAKFEDRQKYFYDFQYRKERVGEIWKYKYYTKKTRKGKWYLQYENYLKVVKQDAQTRPEMGWAEEVPPHAKRTLFLHIGGEHSGVVGDAEYNPAQEYPFLKHASCTENCFINNDFASSSTQIKKWYREEWEFVA